MVNCDKSSTILHRRWLLITYSHGFNFRESANFAISWTFKNETGTGLMVFLNKMMKNTAKNELIKPITNIIYYLLHTGVFPDPLNIFNVVPLYSK